MKRTILTDAAILPHRREAAAVQRAVEAIVAIIRDATELSPEQRLVLLEQIEATGLPGGG